MVKARTTIAARIVIMKAAKILWNKFNFTFFPLTAEWDVCPKKWKTEALELCYGFLHVRYDP